MKTWSDRISRKKNPDLFLKKNQHDNWIKFVTGSEIVSLVTIVTELKQR